MDVALMIEGQDGLTWERWQRLARLAEELGFAGLFRSDHFTNAQPPAKDSLELWTSLTWLASHTQRIEFGPLVTPLSFRHPVFTARMGKDVDALAEGRLILGMGGGWQVREHEMFGFPLLLDGGRFDRFEEGVTVVHRLLRQEEPVSIEGEYFQLREAILLPRPAAPGRPRLLIGGNGPKRTLPLTARLADEWNGVLITPERFGELNRRLTDLIKDEGRDPQSVRRSIMVNVTFGEDEKTLKEKAEARGKSIEQIRDGVNLVGSAGAVIEGIEAYEAEGAERVMLQWLEMDDTEGLRRMAQDVLPAFHNG